MLNIVKIKREVVDGMNISICIIIFIMAIICSLNSNVAALDETIFFEEIPRVITAGRVEQKITETSAAVYVVTAEDIKQSGITDIPEALRLVPGVNVVQLTSGNYQISMRDFNQFAAIYILTMIDGQIIYADCQGETDWAGLPIAIEEVDRIEVVKGPGSVLFGANAYSGLINIITKRAEDADGGLIKVNVGEYNSIVGSAIYSYRSDNVGCRVSMAYDKIDSMKASQMIIPTDREPEYKACKDIIKGNLLLDYYFGYDAKVSLQTSISKGRRDQTVPSLYCNQDQILYLASIRYERSDLKLMLYQRSIIRPLEGSYCFIPSAGPSGIIQNASDIMQDITSLELQHTIHAGKENSIKKQENVWGRLS